MAKKNKTVSSEKNMTLNEYLSNFNSKRSIDNVIKKWYLKKDKLNSLKPKTFWDAILKQFFNETEK